MLHPEEEVIINKHLNSKCVPEFSEDHFKDVRASAIVDYNDEHSPTVIILNT